MLQTAVDGVPVYLADVPGPFSAGLVFGVGRQDETFVRGGLTHLVEHLVMSAVGRTPLDANASVDLEVTEFTATGPAERVVDFLHAVCLALSDLALADLPLDRLAVEADVLRTEGGSVAGPALGALLGEVYGAAGPGLAGVREPAVLALGDEDVRTWTHRWFTRTNAALWLTGPLPPGLVLPLPDGVVPERPPAHPLPLPLPAWTNQPVGGSVAIGAEVADDPALTTTLAVLRARVEQALRHRRGVSYSVSSECLAVSADRRFALLATDVRDGQESLAAHVLWRQLELLAQAGPDPDELARDREDLEAFLDDPRAAAAEVSSAARNRVRGLPRVTRADLRRRAAAVTPEGVRRAAAAMRDGALLCVPPDVDGPPAGPGRLVRPSSPVVAGRGFARRRGSVAPRGSRLVVGEEGLGLVVAAGEQLTVRWPDVVGLVRTGAAAWIVVARDGAELPVVPEDWRAGSELLAAVRAAVPADLQVDEDDLAELRRGLLLVRAPRHRVAEALAVSGTDAEVVGTGEWTAVRPSGGALLPVVHAGVAAAVGRRTTGLVLRREHADLEYELFRGGRPVDRHRFGAGTGDAAALAAATGRDTARLGALLAADGGPDDVLAALVAELGLPAEVPDLLAGLPVPGAELVRGRGLVGGIRAAVRGDHAPAPGTGSRLDRWAHLSRTRPGWYRALNAASAAVLGLLVWLAVGVGDRGWSLLVVLAVLAAVSCVWEARPGRRAAGAEPAAGPEPALPPPGHAGGSAPARGASSGSGTVTSSGKQ